jgi:hypothetical protein
MLVRWRRLEGVFLLPFAGHSFMGSEKQKAKMQSGKRTMKHPL